MGALETLHAKFGCQLLFVESGGDNLAANYSRELADYIIYVIDVAVCHFDNLLPLSGVRLISLGRYREATRFLVKVAQESHSPIFS